MPIDYNNYPEDWKDIIRPEILKRDGYKCKQCKVPHKAKGYREPSGQFIECDEFMLRWAKANGFKCIRIILTIAHLCHFSKCEKREHLSALCQKCHLALDAPVKKVMRKTPAKKALACLPIADPLRDYRKV